MTREELSRIARECYPEGFPPEEDDYTQDPLPYQRTPQYERWREGWRKALEWQQWEALWGQLKRDFPGHTLGEGTQPYQSSCRRSIVYFNIPPLHPGTHVLVRLTAAASILAPVYLIYMTVETTKGPYSCRELFLDLPEEMRPHARRLADILEQQMGYSPFPRDLADVPLEGLRIYFLNRPSWEGATLLEAFFSDHLDNLP